MKDLTDPPLEASLSPGITIRPWVEADFPAIQRLSSAEGWPTPETRPAESLISWQRAWPALVAVDETGELVGFLRALSDGEVTTYVAELLVAPELRGRGIGRALVAACHDLVPRTRLDVLATASSQSYYSLTGWRPFYGFRKSSLV